MTATLGVVAMASAVSGYLKGRLSAVERALMGGVAICLIAAEGVSDGVGLVAVVAAGLLCYYRNRRPHQAPEATRPN